MSQEITHLEDHQVFVFGSNSTGFSCSGSAGMAIRGPDWKKVNWRDDPFVARALKAPPGHIDRKGHWGYFGVARGWSQGWHGMSYAIETIRRPGWKRSTPLGEIEDQMIDLCQFATIHPGWTFLMTAVGSMLAGYTNEEMAATFRAALSRWGTRPGNLIIPPDLYGQDWTRWTTPPRAEPSALP